jgi:hypothetical protein
MAAATEDAGDAAAGWFNRTMREHAASVDDFWQLSTNNSLLPNGDVLSPLSPVVDTRPPTALATTSGAIVMGLFLAGGLLGNMLIIISIASNRKARNVTNAFIISLCINDVTSLLLVVALIVDSYVWRGWNAGDFMCRLNPELNVALTGSSMWHAALIAVHRYIVVVHNDGYKRLSRTSAYPIFVLVAARAIPLACAAPGFSLDTSGYSGKMLRCVLLPTHAWRMMTVMLVGTVAPCLIVAVCYSVIFCVVCRVARRARGADTRMKRELNITKMFAMAFGTILLGYVPYAVVRNGDKDNTIHADAYVAVSVFYGIATCMNPLIYGAMSTQVKAACMLTLRRFLLALHADRVSCCRGSCCDSLLMEKGDTALDAANENTMPLVVTTIARNSFQTDKLPRVAAV